MRKGKNSDIQIVRDYRKTIRGPSSDDPEFYEDVKKEYEAFERKDPNCAAYRIYLRCNAGKKGREARFSKDNVFLALLLIKIGREKRVIEYLKSFSPLLLNQEKELDDWKKFTEIVNRLNDEGILKVDIVSSSDARSIHRYKKSKIIEKALAIIRLDSEIELIERQDELISKVEEEIYKFKNFSPEMVDFMFRNLNKKKYFDPVLSKKKLKELMFADKFLGKIIDDIRGSGGSIKIWKIARKHTKTILELKPYLRYLKNEKLAFQKNGTIFLNCYDPGNNKKFMWLADSCYWTFGPKLENEKVYNSNDFIRQDVVESWVETGSAKFT